ncbi:hypothetical protein CBR_g19132 [Chara braunii]|uniref:Uncharacterized protein n=1 Tax=Chara braunii TaxID=69332 RepID=A0A388KXF6_CHABU|nr:hypothetical protein CBR_g19132 [Chara braunii]|eukprot:GBG74725.1 hypothetical protein CBR_g19132 [Chara braunii]
MAQCHVRTAGFAPTSAVTRGVLEIAAGLVHFHCDTGHSPILRGLVGVAAMTPIQVGTILAAIIRWLRLREHVSVLSAMIVMHVVISAVAMQQSTTILLVLCYHHSKHTVEKGLRAGEIDVGGDCEFDIELEEHGRSSSWKARDTRRNSGSTRVSRGHSSAKFSYESRRGFNTKGGTTTHPYTPEEEAKAAAILKEKREKREAKKKAVQKEQATKLKKIEEEMARENERIKKEEERKLKEVQEEEEEDETPLQRKRGQYSGSRDEEMEKRISEWVANLSLGEEEEVAMYISKDDQEAAMRVWEAEKDVVKRKALEDEKRMEWKLAVMREKKRRVDAAAEAAKELEEVQKIEEQLAAQTELPNQMRVIARNVARLTRIQAEQYDFSRSQHIVVRSIKLGFQDFAAATPKEEEARPPRREPVKVNFSDSYSGKREENFDNWEANVKTYVHLQQVSPDQQVLIAIHALRDEAASFARSLVRAANCSDDPVAYSSFTSLTEFLKLLRERFADVTRSVKASDKLQTIHAHTQLVALFYRAMPEAFRGHFFAKSEDPATTYDSLSREVVAFEAKSVSVSTFWHKDLDKGKQWKGRTISGQVKTKDSLVLTLDEGSVDEIPYDPIEWGLEEEDSGVG